MSGLSEDGGKTLWHGRFESGPADALLAFTSSLPFDVRIGGQDIRASKAHVRGLARVGLLTIDEETAILAALDQTGNELAEGTLTFVETDEDIHTAIERRVTEIAGEPGGKLHTGRSRNDQVATAFRLWVQESMTELADQVLAFQRVLLNQATAVGDAYLPGYTHLQRAQPVPLAHHLAAHAWAFARDFDRLADGLVRADVSPLGAGALAGSSLPLDPAATAKDLGFGSVFDNSLDVTSDRDFVAEALFAMAMIGIHLSRIGEEFVLWCSSEFGFVSLDDAFSTGSSMMPQKKNADIAELTRGKTGRLVGNLTAMLVTLKGLPLAYNRDLQEDKESLFDSFDQLSLAMVALGGMIETCTFNVEVMAIAADDQTALATDLAEVLVESGMPFREAHGVVGALVRESLSGPSTLSELAAASPAFDASITELFEPGAAVARRQSPGGAGLIPVAKQLSDLEAQIKNDQSRLGDVGHG